MANAIETSIRRAIAASASNDPKTRLAIYQAAERAVERIVSADGPEEGQAKRRELASAIEAIEADYGSEGSGTPAEPATFDEAPEVGIAEDGDGNAPMPEMHRAPVLGAARREPFDEDAAPEPSTDEGPIEEPGREPRAFAPPLTQEREAPFEDEVDLGSVKPLRREARSAPTPEVAGVRGPGGTERILPGQDGNAAPETWRPGAGRAKRQHRSRGGPLLSGLILLLFLFLVAAAVWMIAPLLFSSNGGDGPVATDVSSAEVAADRDWIDVFTGRELGQIVTPNGGRVETTSAPDGSDAVLITAPNDGAGAEIGLTLGPGVVSRLAGREARAELVVGSPDGAERVFSVRCVFADENRCGRQRFTVQQASAPFVFALDLADMSAESGQILVDPALGEGGDLLVYALRVRAGGAD